MTDLQEIADRSSTDVTVEPLVRMAQVGSNDLRPVYRINASQILAGDSPRLDGQDEAHVKLLAASDARLPPIIVHRETMRVIDGMHRLQCAKMLGHRTVDVVFFDGEERDAFIEGVRANISHGKPLTLSDRRAAATRILESHCHLSDRAISEICGLSSKTVGSLRQRASASVPQSRARIGLDGRVRPLDASAGRLRAAEVLAERPGASLREVASVAGISPGTVRDVRDRLRQGRDAVVSRPAPASEPCEEPSRPCPIETVGSDPAITSSEEGRALLEWMMGHAVTSQDWAPFVDAVPVSRIYLVADAARKVATAWVGFAESLEKRTHRR